MAEDIFRFGLLVGNRVWLRTRACARVTRGKWHPTTLLAGVPLPGIDKAGQRKRNVRSGNENHRLHARMRGCSLGWEIRQVQVSDSAYKGICWDKQLIICLELNESVIHAHAHDHTIRTAPRPKRLLCRGWRARMSAAPSPAITQKVCSFEPIWFHSTARRCTTSTPSHHLL